MFTTSNDGEDEKKALQIHEEYRDLMIYTAKRVLKNQAMAEDAASESFLKIYSRLDKIEDVYCEKTRALIIVIVKNTAINIYNRMKRESGNLEMNDIVDESAYIPGEEISAESEGNIVSLIKSLPDILRDVAFLSIVYELSNKDIAEITSLSYDVVRKRLSRARNILMKKLSKEYGDWR